MMSYKINFVKIRPVMLFVLISFVWVFPIGALAYNFIPCSGEASGIAGTVKCDFNALLKLVSNVLNYLVASAAMVATFGIILAGIYYTMTPVSDKKAQAKKILKDILYGFLIVLSAYLLLRTFIVGLIDPSTEPGGKINQTLQN